MQKIFLSIIGDLIIAGAPICVRTHYTDMRCDDIIETKRKKNTQSLTTPNRATYFDRKFFPAALGTGKKQEGCDLRAKRRLLSTIFFIRRIF